MNSGLEVKYLKKETKISKHGQSPLTLDHSIDKSKR